MEWQLAAQAVFARGCSVVTIYATLGPEGVEHGVRRTQAEVVICDGKLLKNLLAVAPNCPSLKYVVTMGDVSPEAVKKLPRGVAHEKLRRRRAGRARKPLEPSPRAGGHRGDHVHLGHHGRAQGRGAVAQQRVRDDGGPRRRRRLHEQGRVPGVPPARAYHGDGRGDGHARHRRGDRIRLAPDPDGHRAEARRRHARRRAHAPARSWCSRPPCWTACGRRCRPSLRRHPRRCGA